MNSKFKKWMDEYKKNNPIHDCLGSTGGRWKWRRYLDGIDLRYGHSTKKAAEMARAKCARESWSMHLYEERPTACHCGEMVPRWVIDSVGECLKCAEIRESYGLESGSVGN